MNKILVCILLAVVIGGCGIEKSFQPPGPTYSYFKKPGASELDVKKVMLECGIEPISGKSAKTGNNDMNTFFLAKWCMDKAGYKSVNLEIKKSCQLEHNKQYPACQPGAVIPKPSVERRLNSEYCKSAREMISEEKYQRCMQVEAVDPLYSTTAEDCAYEYKDLRAECRP